MRVTHDYGVLRNFVLLLLLLSYYDVKFRRTDPAGKGAHIHGCIVLQR
jgi:hypothetical protein